MELPTGRVVHVGTYGLAFLLLLAPANAWSTICDSTCEPCGFALARPLAERIVSTDHEVEVLTSCADEGIALLPSLWDDAGVLPSDWEPVGEAHYSSENVQWLQLWRRVGPDLPSGKRVALGARGPLACQLMKSNCSTDTCAINPDVDCCSRHANAELSPLFGFDVEAEVAFREVSSADAAGDAGSSDTDAGNAGSSDAGAGDAGSSDTGTGDAGSNALTENTPSTEAPALALRCVTSPSVFYLDVGSAPFDDRIVEIEVEWVPDAQASGVVRWFSQPCLGESLRTFTEPQGRVRTLSDGVYTYVLRARGENGPLGYVTGTLRVPDDCAPMPEDSWHGSPFVVACSDESQVIRPEIHRELTLTTSADDCTLLPQLPPDQTPLFSEAPPQDAPLPVTAAAPSIQPGIVTSRTPVPAIADPILSRSRDSNCAVAASRRLGRFAWSPLLFLMFLGLARHARRRASLG